MGQPVSGESCKFLLGVTSEDVDPERPDYISPRLATHLSSCEFCAEAWCAVNGSVQTAQDIVGILGDVSHPYRDIEFRRLLEVLKKAQRE